jgi:hypothetical protein
MLILKGNRIQSKHHAILVKLKRIIKEIEIQKRDEEFDNAFGGTESSFTNFIQSQRHKRIQSK